jgi:hypothetical protein
MEKAELIIAALQQRMGDLVSNYETQIAMLRAEITYMMNENSKKEKDIADYNAELLEKVEELS